MDVPADKVIAKMQAQIGLMAGQMAISETSGEMTQHALAQSALDVNVWKQAHSRILAALDEANAKLDEVDRIEIADGDRTPSMTLLT